MKVEAVERGVESSTSTIKNHGGKYLTFILENEVYGVQITKVQEIIRMQNVTGVPRVKNFVRGVINLRGKIIPVIELRIKFDMERQTDTEKNMHYCNSGCRRKRKFYDRHHY